MGKRADAMVADAKATGVIVEVGELGVWIEQDEDSEAAKDSANPRRLIGVPFEGLLVEVV